MSLNLNFGRRDSNSNIIYAPKPLEVDGVNIFTNDPEVYHANDWFDVIINEQPEPREGYIIIPNWRENIAKKQVINFWKYEVAPEPEPSEMEILRDDVTEIQNDVSSHDLLIETIIDQLTEHMITLCMYEIGLDDFEIEE